MSNYASEIDLLEVLSAHDDIVRRCVRGDIEFREFVRLYDGFWCDSPWMGTNPTARTGSSLNVTPIAFSFTGKSRRKS